MQDYELTPRYDARASFYGKARVQELGDLKRLISYTTHVATINPDGQAVIHGLYSATTTRHIKEFLKQNGFKVESTKQILHDYSGKAVE